MIRSFAATAVTLLWAAIVVIVGGRFLVLLFNANRDSEIVSWLLRHSDFWVKPFFNVFDLTNKAVHSSGGVFEPASLIALVVYSLAAMVVLAILRRAWVWPM
jgi:hypothetical protein